MTYKRDTDTKHSSSVMFQSYYKTTQPGKIVHIQVNYYNANSDGITMLREITITLMFACD